MSEIDFSPKFIASQRELAETANQPPFFRNPEADGDVCVTPPDLGKFGANWIGHFYALEDETYWIAAANHYPAALAEIERLRAELNGEKQVREYMYEMIQGLHEEYYGALDDHSAFELLAIRNNVWNPAKGIVVHKVQNSD